jgi:hypothetical protein
MKNQLIFDTTDAQSILDSDNVGAFIRASDGTLIDKETINSVERLAVDSTLKDGSGVALTSTLISGKQSLDVNVTSGINVEVDLSHVDDSVRLGDGTDFFTSHTVNTDVGLDVYVIGGQIEVSDAALANTAIENSVNVLNTADTAEAVVATALVNRKYLFIANNDNTKVFIGKSGVTAANGFPLSPGSVMELRAGAAVSPFFVGQAGKTPEVRILELA